MTHLWSGRFDTPPDAGVFEFGRSFSFDRRLFEEDVAGSLAWADALGEAGVLTADDVRLITTGLRGILDEGRRDASSVEGPDEDVHAFVERRLVERVGEAGKRLHTGRSRNEQVALDLRLYLLRRIPAMQQDLVRLVAALAGQAAGAGSALMPSYTHLRRAQPILAAHFFLAHAVAFRRDHGRLADACREADCLPLGSGAVAGTSYAVDVHAIAKALGFTRVAANSVDATSDRDFVSTFLHAAALVMVHLSRLAEDLVVFTSEEFGYFVLDDSLATGSSLMPQKKNPDPLELVRGKAGRVAGHLAGWLMTMKGLPSGYNKDLQEDKSAVFDTEDTLRSSLATAATLVGGLTLDPGRSAAAASGLLLATDVADYLVARGMPFRAAHELVGGMVRRLHAERRTFEDLALPEWQAYSPLFTEEVRRVVSAEASVAARRTPQSTHPASVAAALAETREWAAGLVASRASS
jgi:argininosuccinate lyase